MKLRRISLPDRTRGYEGDVAMRWLLLLGVSVMVTGTALAEESRRVQLLLRETAGVERVVEPVTTGIPLPRGAASDVRGLRLVRSADGQQVPAQFRVTGHWRPGGSIRWVLVDFQADLPAGGRQEYVLEFGPGVGAKATVASPVEVEEEPDRYIVDTGAARFVLSRKRFGLFQSVALSDGTALVESPSPASGGVLGGIGRTVTRAIPDSANEGDHHLIYAEASREAPAEDWTLTFTDDANHFELAGSVTGADGTGEASWGGAFRSRSGRLILPEDAWLVYRQARKGDSFTFSTVPAGSTAHAEAIFSSCVREGGPLRTVIELKGSVGLGQAPALEFTAWYHFYAGSSKVRLDFTLENNDHSGRTETGNVRNARIGTPNTVFFDEFALRLPLRTGEDPHWALLGDARSPVLTGSLKEPVELYQDSSGTDHWDRYRQAEYHPRPNSYVSFPGYRVYEGEEVAAEGRQAVGWLDVSGPAGGVGVTVRDFWQNFPKGLRAEPGDVEVKLFPGRYAGDFPLRPGEHKTHRMLFDFHGPGRDPAEGAAVAQAFSDPLLLEASAQWWAETGVLGVLHPYDPERFPAYEVRNLSAIGAFPEGFTGERRSLQASLDSTVSRASPREASLGRVGGAVRRRRCLLSQIEALDFYGWMDYGDVPIDFEAETGQWNLKYDFDMCMLRQYTRTGRREWLRLFRAAAIHAADIDTFHAPHYPELHFLKGGNWAHSLHDEPGHENPHRNYNHFTRDLSFAARGPINLYYLTGDWKAYESFLERAENALAPYMSPQEEPPDSDFAPMGVRGHAGTMQRLVDAYLLTGEGRFAERARWCVKESAFGGQAPPGETYSASLWSMTFYALALHRYCEVFPDDELARRSFLAHADVIARSVDPRGENGAAYTVTVHPDGRVDREGTCAHYNIMVADALAYAYRMTGKKDYLDAAGRAFPYGVRNACWEDGPATYFHVHSAAGSTHGSVYMATVVAEGE